MQTFAVLMSVLLPSGMSTVTHSVLRITYLLSPRHHPLWHPCVVRASRDFGFVCLSSILVLHHLTRTMKQVYAAHTRKVCLVCLIDGYYCVYSTSVVGNDSESLVS